MNKEALLAHIDARLECLKHQAHGSVPVPGWLAEPGEHVDLTGYGIADEPQSFDFAAWRKTPNPAFDGRTPQQVIDCGTDVERSALADAVSAIAALLDGAFS